MNYRITLLIPLFLTVLLAQERTVTGRVLDIESGEPVTGASVYAGSEGSITGFDGEFIFQTKSDSITISYIGYRTKTIQAGTDLKVFLSRKILSAEPVWVEATRAVQGITPVAFSSLTPEEIGLRYTVEDVPMILAGEPGVYAYSESGNGTGYSYISIRGFDQSRIAVMLNGVPLNDNESHQVYWVDHADILSDAVDVQIQRGIGNSLYGSAAFGGSINILTGPDKDTGFSFYAGAGSYNTIRTKIKYTSKPVIDKRLQIFSRVSFLTSNGYRDFHDSKQKSLTAGANFNGLGGIHEFRVLRGIERSNLAWDGVPVSSINDHEKRRASYQAYIDDFVQDIVSLRSVISISPAFRMINVTYTVRGKGYYETEKNSANIYDYNLDIKNLLPDSVEQVMTTGLLQRKWIVNSYTGLIPSLSFKMKDFRIDAGMEFRTYAGDHFGEVSDLSNDSLAILQSIDDGWYRFYRYVGEKTSMTGFGHVSWKALSWLNLVGDIQVQRHDWLLEQDEIGHAAGHKLNAIWEFVNPRAGLTLNATDKLSVFLNYGKGQKEPADAQIISADDVWSEPKLASAEVIHDYEAGFNYLGENIKFGLNAFRIDYFNEQLKNIDIEKEGEYDYTFEESTIHSGIEFEFSYSPGDKLKTGGNGTIISVKNKADEWLPGIPENMFNLWASVNILNTYLLYGEFRHTGKQRIIWDWEGRTIAPANIVNLKLSAKFSKTRVGLKINNLFNRLYETQAYAWDTYYYWPGATRNYFIEIETTL